MTALSPGQMFILDLACRPIEEAGIGSVYMVGTANQREHPHRDVDVRTIVSDKQYDRMLKAIGFDGITLFGMALGQYLASLTGLPIDFQFQRQTEANEKHQGMRNPLGHRSLSSFPGDAVPKRTRP